MIENSSGRLLVVVSEIAAAQTDAPHRGLVELPATATLSSVVTSLARLFRAPEDDGLLWCAGVTLTPRGGAPRVGVDADLRLGDLAHRPGDDLLWRTADGRDFLLTVRGSSTAGGPLLCALDEDDVGEDGAREVAARMADLPLVVVPEPALDPAASGLLPDLVRAAATCPCGCDRPARPGDLPVQRSVPPAPETVLVEELARNPLVQAVLAMADCAGTGCDAEDLVGGLWSQDLPDDVLDLPPFAVWRAAQASQAVVVLGDRCCAGPGAVGLRTGSPAERLDVWTAAFSGCLRGIAELYLSAESGVDDDDADGGRQFHCDVADDGIGPWCEEHEDACREAYLVRSAAARRLAAQLVAGTVQQLHSGHLVGVPEISVGVTTLGLAGLPAAMEAAEQLLGWFVGTGAATRKVVTDERSPVGRRRGVELTALGRYTTGRVLAAHGLVVHERGSLRHVPADALLDRLKRLHPEDWAWEFAEWLAARGDDAKTACAAVLRSAAGPDDDRPARRTALGHLVSLVDPVSATLLDEVCDEVDDPWLHSPVRLGRLRRRRKPVPAADLLWTWVDQLGGQQRVAVDSEQRHAWDSLVRAVQTPGYTDDLLRLDHPLRAAVWARLWRKAPPELRVALDPRVRHLLRTSAGGAGEGGAPAAARTSAGRAARRSRRRAGRR